MNHHFIVLKKGQEIFEEITEFCRKHQINSAYFSMIGAVSQAEIGFYDLEKKQYYFKKFNEDLEICTATGNISLFEGSPMIHAHGTFSDKEMAATGGHIKSAKTAGTCEIFLVPLNRKLVRKHDPNTGLNLIE